MHFLSLFCNIYSIGFSVKQFFFHVTYFPLNVNNCRRYQFMCVSTEKIVDYFQFTYFGDVLWPDEFKCLRHLFVFTI